jgi:hypothetical protein
MFLTAAQEPDPVSETPGWVMGSPAMWWEVGWGGVG